MLFVSVIFLVGNFLSSVTQTETFSASSRLKTLATETKTNVLVPGGVTEEECYKVDEEECLRLVWSWTA